MKDSVVLIACNSGSTFSCLALSNLLQALTQKIFVITSEFDTEVRAALKIESRRVCHCYDFMTFLSDFSTTSQIASAFRPSKLTESAVIYIQYKCWNSICWPKNYHCSCNAPNVDSNPNCTNGTGT